MCWDYVQNSSKYFFEHGNPFSQTRFVATSNKMCRFTDEAFHLRRPIFELVHAILKIPSFAQRSRLGLDLVIFLERSD